MIGYSSRVFCTVCHIFQPRFSLSGVGTAALSSALCGGGNEDDDEQWDHFLNTDQ
jgi:mono/diheme cytochrome c family protein